MTDDSGLNGPTRRHRTTEVNLREYLEARIDSGGQLDEQRWEAHKEQHTAIARNLTEYKSQSNEWRGALSDMRLSFVTKDEIKSLLAQAEGTHTGFEGQFEQLEKLIAAEREERRDQQNLRVGRSAGLSQSAAILLSLLAVGGTMVGIVATLLAILR